MEIQKMKTRKEIEDRIHKIANYLSKPSRERVADFVMSMINHREHPENGFEVEWKHPEDFKKFRTAALDAGVPSSVFWGDAAHCTCFGDSKDGDEMEVGILHAMYNLWKTKNEIIR